MWQQLDKARTAAAHYKEAWETVRELCERFGIMADMTTAVVQAAGIKAGAALPPPDNTTTKV
jgi:threonine synthase